ncbi:MAG: 16S rRNA (guanine(527)-N(7))-methyltransferase RsmG [Bacillota bacterium]|nr:16S rRNA (guanine(527)-N(7))-methyltransferase RsmG [Bacillota bacterium]
MENLRDVFRKLQIDYSPSKEDLLMAYMEEILELNQHINLTAITDREEFIKKHYIDSLLCVDSNEFKSAKTIIDVGTGGGFPGIPLAIAFPEKKFILIDSLNKRIKIINDLCAKLGIRNVEAIHGRAEELARRKDMRECFDLCVSRAVANMSTLSEYCLPFVKRGGAFIAYKGPDCGEEVAAAAKAIKVLGGKIAREESPSLEGLPFEHKLIFIIKENNTGSKYPRKAGTPSKEPIS